MQDVNDGETGGWEGKERGYMGTVSVLPAQFCNHKTALKNKVYKLK